MQIRKNIIEAYSRAYSAEQRRDGRERVWSKIQQLLAREQGGILLLDTNDVAFGTGGLALQLEGAGFGFTKRAIVVGGEFVMYTNGNAIVLLNRPLCRASNSQWFVSFYELMLRSFLVVVLCRFGRKVRGLPDLPKDVAFDNPINSMAAWQVVRCGMHQSRYTSTEFWKEFATPESVLTLRINALGRTSSDPDAPASKCAKEPWSSKEKSTAVMRPVDHGILLRARCVITAADTPEKVSRLYDDLDNLFREGRTCEAAVRQRWNYLLQNQCVLGSALHVRLQTEREGRRDNAGNTLTGP